MEQNSSWHGFVPRLAYDDDHRLDFLSTHNEKDTLYCSLQNLSIESRILPYRTYMH